MKILSVALAGVIALTAGQGIAAQKCDTNKPESTPVSRFKDNGDGTITDTKTKLTWRHCVLGMSWNGQTCEGQSAVYDFVNARLAIEELNEAKDSNRSNWRLPTAQELETIVESRCFKPAINLEVFPYSPESGFWTGTEVSGLITQRMAVIHFINGGEYIANKNQSWRIRPVAAK